MIPVIANFNIRGKVYLLTPAIRRSTSYFTVELLNPTQPTSPLRKRLRSRMSFLKIETTLAETRRKSAALG